MHCLVVVIRLYATGPSVEQRVEQKNRIFDLCARRSVCLFISHVSHFLIHEDSAMVQYRPIRKKTFAEAKCDRQVFRLVHCLASDLGCKPHCCNRECNSTVTKTCFQMRVIDR